LRGVRAEAVERRKLAAVGPDVDQRVNQRCVRLVEPAYPVESIS
jgi:hypothetical protein